MSRLKIKQGVLIILYSNARELKNKEFTWNSASKKDGSLSG